MKQYSGDFVFEILIPILVLFAISYAIYTWKIRKLSFDQLVEGNIIKFFKILQALTTTGEVIVLSHIAMEAGRMGLSDVIFRFGLLGLAEVITTWAFISSLTRELEKAAEDGIINIFEAVRLILVCGPIFFIAFLCTNGIFLAYLESCNYLEIQMFLYNDYKMWTMPLGGLHLETNPNLFTPVMFDDLGNILPVRRVELTAIYSIYATPIFNLFLIYFVYQDVKKKYLKKRGKVSLKEQIQIFWEWVTGRTKTSNTLNKIKGLASYHNLIQKNIGINISVFESWVYEYIGKNLSTGRDAKGSNTKQEVIDGKESSVDALRELTNRLIGKSGTSKSGLAGLNDIIVDLNTRKLEIKACIDAIDIDSKEHADLSATGSADARTLSSITVRINSNKSKIRTHISDIEKGFTNYDVLKDEIIDQLSNFGFSSVDPMHSDTLLEECRDLINIGKTKV